MASTRIADCRGTPAARLPLFGTCGSRAGRCAFAQLVRVFVGHTDLFAVDELEQQLGGTMARTDDIAAHNGQVREHRSAHEGIVPRHNRQIAGDVESHFPGDAHAGHGHNIVVVDDGGGARIDGQ